MTTQQEDDIGLEQVDLLVEEVAARLDLDGFGIAVARRTALHDVGDVDISPVEPDRLEQACEQPACCADERFALAILGGVLGVLVFGSAALYRLLNAVLARDFPISTWHDIWHFTVDGAVSARAYSARRYCNLP